tara:strand:- start:528 stop:1577 length:1050 start_codon:yes stop_codon:yes gene_type:complete
MKKLLFISFFIIGCNSSNKNDPIVVEKKAIVVNSKSKNVLYEIDKEIISNPKSPNVYLKRALYYQNKRDFTSALEDINRALSITPDISFLKYHKAAILYELAVFNQDVSLIDESKIYLDNCIKEDSEIIPARLLRAKIFLFEKKTEQAMKLANQVLKIDKRIAEAYFIKGMIYHFLGNSDLASSSYQTAIEVDPNYFDAYIHMGMISENLGNDIAIDYYNSAIEINSSSIEAYRNKGLYYHFNENYLEARKAFKFIIRIDSNFEETYFNIGNTFLGEFNVLNNNSTLDSALFYYQKANSINSFYVQAIHNIGICYEIKKDLKRAKSFYKKAIEIDNNYIPSFNALNSLD